MKQQNIREYFQEFVRQWPKEAPYYVWGTSTTAVKICSFFKEKLNIIGFVDSDKKKWGTLFQNRPVLSPDEFFLKRGINQCIVASMAYGEISYDLEQRGLVENIDFCNGWYFMGLHHYLDTHQVYFYRVDISITSYCTLHCRDCNMLMPYYKHHHHYLAKNILSDVDAYFRWVDHVDQFNILGGEPFLHPDVELVTKKIVEDYRSRINDLVFFSNGTIIPDEGLLDLMAEYQIRVDIGDYRSGVPAIRSKVDDFVQTLKQRGIRYSLSVSDTWLDFNHTPENRKNWDKEKLIEVCRRCREPFRGLHNQKFYFCHLNASADLAGLYLEEEGDYFDLSQQPNETGKEELLAFDLACFPKGYVSYCRYCGGCGPANRKIVSAAEQLPIGYQGRS